MRWISSSVRSLVRLVGSSCAAVQIFCAVVLPIPYRYCSEVSICFSRGRSTPAIRAMYVLSSALPLLVTGVRGADHADHALAADHLALHADLLHRSTDLHGFLQPTRTPRNRFPSSRTPNRGNQPPGPTRNEGTAACNSGTPLCQGACRPVNAAPLAPICTSSGR